MDSEIYLSEFKTYMLSTKVDNIFLVNRLGKVKNKITGTIYSSTSNGKYIKITLPYKYIDALEDAKEVAPRGLLVHRMVAETFIPVDRKLLELTGRDTPLNNRRLNVLFKDGDTHNLHYKNLYWTSMSDIAKHRARTKTHTDKKVILSSRGMDDLEFTSILKATEYMGVKYSTILTGLNRNNGTYVYNGWLIKVT